MTPALSRRQVLRTGAGAAAGILAAGIAAPPAAAAGTNPASVPSGAPLINVSNPSTKWLDGVVNRDTSTTVQGFAFDAVNGDFYTLQVAGMSQVAYLRSGSQVALTASLGAPDHEEAGDLCLTRHDLTGAVTGYMYLLGFGHGVSLGVEPATATTPAYLWTEASATTYGYGMEVVRFPFADQTVLWTSHPAVRRLSPPEPGITAMTPSVDGTYDILLLRYKLGEARWYAAYDLSAARAAAVNGTALPAPLAKIQQPALYKEDADRNLTTTPATFQGFTSFGRYVYMLDGDARTSDPTLPLSGVDRWTIHTTSMDLNGTQNNPNTGYILRTHSEADPNADPREPEGMAMYVSAGAPRLCFGITDNAGSTRQFDLYYKV